MFERLFISLPLPLTAPSPFLPSLYLLLNFPFHYFHHSGKKVIAAFTAIPQSISPSLDLPPAILLWSSSHPISFILHHTLPTHTCPRLPTSVDITMIFHRPSSSQMTASRVDYPQDLNCTPATL